MVGGGQGGGGGGGGGAVGGGGGENLSCAVDHVIRWATTVMTAVEKIQWRPLGSCYWHYLQLFLAIIVCHLCFS